MQQELESSGTSIALSLGVQRSKEWNSVRNKHLKIQEQSYCAVCLGTEMPQVHHIIPFHLCHLVYRGDLELDERNLMTLCEVPENNHHLLLGHLSDWEIYNPAGRAGIIAAFKGKTVTDLTAAQIELAEIWQQWMANKPLRWGDMQDKDKSDLRAFLDANLPFIPTPEYAVPYPFMQDGDDGHDPQKIATTYGSRWQIFLGQVEQETAATDTTSQAQAMTTDTASQQ